MRRVFASLVVVFVFSGLLSAQISVPRGIPKQKADVNVERAAMATPEVTLADATPLTAGASKVVTLKLKNFDAGRISGVKVSSFCAVSGLQVVSPAEVKFNLSVTKEADGSGCYGQFLDVKQNRILSWNVPYISQREQVQRASREKEAAREEQMRKDAMKPYQEQIAKAKQVLGKQWLLELDGGQKDTLKLSSIDGMTGIYKNLAGKEVKVTFMYGNIMIEYNAKCLLQGALDGKSVSGMSMGPECPGGKTMGRWSGTVQ